MARNVTMRGDFYDVECYAGLSGESDNGDAGATELHMLVAVRGYTGNRIEVLAQSLPQGAGAGAVEDAHFTLIKLYGVVDEICDCLNGLIDTHAAHIDLALEL